MGFNKYLKDDKDNYSVTRLVFFINSIFILCYIGILLIIPVTFLHFQIIISLTTYNMAIIGVKNWKDFINKK